MDCRTALLTVLDQVDYTAGACRPNEMVGAVLPKEVITLARKAIADEEGKQIAEVVEMAKQVSAEFKKGVYCKYCEILVEYGDMKPWHKDDETVDMLCPGCDGTLVTGE
jgi:hypothetical protein